MKQHFIGLNRSDNYSAEKHRDLHRVLVIQKNFFEFLFGRNGLRPSRFYVTKDNVMVMASEVGVYDTPPGNVILKVKTTMFVTRLRIPITSPLQCES